MKSNLKSNEDPVNGAITTKNENSIDLDSTNYISRGGGGETTSYILLQPGSDNKQNGQSTTPSNTMSVCYESTNMLPISVSTSSSTHLLEETNTVSQSALPAQTPVTTTFAQPSLGGNLVQIGEKPELPQLQAAKGIAKLVVTNHPGATSCGPLLQKVVNPPLITVLNPSGPLTVVKTLCVTSGVPSAPHFTLVNTAPLTVTNAAVKSPTITLLNAPVTVVKAISAGQQAAEKSLIEAPIGVGVPSIASSTISTVIENRGHNVFVKNTCPDSTVSDMPQSHKLLTANNFPSPNVSNTAQPKTLNGQKSKVKIVSNIVLPGTSQINNNVLLNKTNQQRYAPRHKLVGLNGATPRYLNKPTSFGAANKPNVNHAAKLTQDKSPKRPAHPTHKSHIKTIPPLNSYAQKAQQGIKTLSPQRKHVPGQVQRTGSGLRTIPPQRPHKPPNKPNYIGKHAAQAQKTRQAHGKVKGGKLAANASYNVHAPPMADKKLTELTFNQALTAQIIETLSNNSVGPMPSNRYEMLPMRYDNAFSCPELKQIPEPNKSIDDKNKSGLDALSLICQAVLLDHNYNATLPPDSPTRPPPMNILSPQMNGIPATTMYSPGAAKRRPLPQQVLPISSTSHHTTMPLTQGISNSLLAIRDDDAGSDISDGSDRKHDTEGEETDTAPEAEAVNNDNFEGYGDYVTRCICTFVHDDGYMVECDRCKVWQHVQCVVKNKQVPDEYLCEVCDPTKLIDRQKARAIQQQWLKDRQFVDPKLRKDAKTKEIFKPKETVSDTDSSDGEHVAHPNNVAAKGRHPANRRKNDNAQKQVARQRREVAKEVVQRRQKRKERKTVRKKSKPPPKPASEDEQHSAAAAAAADGWAAHLPQLRQWIEKYEEAVTNHYSPELRARISSIRVNGAHSDVDAQYDASVHKCRVHTQPLTELKYLVSTANLDSNTPVVELRGKYMLSAQHRNSGGSLTTRQHSQRPGPFLFFYRLHKDNTEVCVDTRTYGNSARFVRRSCRPNSELRHCIEKGALHIYIVTLTGVDKNGELTIKHESHDLAAIGTTSIACACGSPDECHVNKTSVKKNGDNSEMTSRKRRGRRTISVCLPETDATKSANEELLSPTLPNLPVPALPSPVDHSPVKVKQEKPEPLIKTEPADSYDTKEEPPKVEVKMKIDIKDEPLDVKPEVVAEPTLAPEVAEEREEEEEDKDDEEDETNSPRSNPVSTRRGSHCKSDKEDEKPGVKRKKKESKKEKCKKLSREERKLEAILRAIEQMEKAESKKQEHQAKQAHRRESEPGPGPGPKEEDKQEPKMKRRRRKGRSRTVSQSARRNRLNSTDSYMTSGDENMLSPNDNAQCNKASPRDMSDPSDNRAVGLLLALSNGENVNKEQKSPARELDSNSNSAHSSPETQLSSACLLVQAAVEPLEQGFKFPKTKKGLMNEWLNKVPEPVQAASSISPSFMNPHITSSLEDASGIYTPTKSASLTQMPSYDSNVQPRGSAKKRWLRQAISEDHSSDRPESPPLSDMVAPPKKRRLPRESLSTDVSPPNTPTSTVPPLTSSMSDRLNPEGCVEIVYNMGAEGDSPTQTLESDAILKERAAKMKQEFAGSLMQPMELSRPELGPLSCLDPRLSRDSHMFANADLVGTVEKTLSILGFENTEHAKRALTPTPKRKLSISEYRQRKKLNANDKSDEADQEAEPNSTEENNSSESFKMTARARSVSTSSSTSLSSSDEELPLDIPAKTPAFNSEPTELERQRELASLRLKKVLGLNVEEPRPALNIEAIVNMEVEPTAKQSTLPFPSPTFPIPGTSASEVPTAEAPLLETPSPEPAQLPETPQPEAAPSDSVEVEKMETEDIPAAEESNAVDPSEVAVDAQPNLPSPCRQEEEVEEEEEEAVKPVQGEPAFEEADSVSYVPPFNNPVYPNENFTNYSSTIDDDSRYEGRNPSPPPNLEKAESSGES